VDARRRPRAAGLVPLAVDTDRRRERVEGEIERNVRVPRGRRRRREIARLRVDVGRQAPCREWLDPLVTDATHVEPGVDHLALLAYRDDVRELRTGKPYGEPDVHRARVRTNAHPRE